MANPFAERTQKTPPGNSTGPVTPPTAVDDGVASAPPATNQTYDAFNPNPNNPDGTIYADPGMGATKADWEAIMAAIPYWKELETAKVEWDAQEAKRAAAWKGAGPYRVRAFPDAAAHWKQFKYLYDRGFLDREGQPKAEIYTSSNPRTKALRELWGDGKPPAKTQPPPAPLTQEQIDDAAKQQEFKDKVAGSVYFDPATGTWVRGKPPTRPGGNDWVPITRPPADRPPPPGETNSENYRGQDPVADSWIAPPVEDVLYSTPPATTRPPATPPPVSPPAEPNQNQAQNRAAPYVARRAGMNGEMSTREVNGNPGVDLKQKALNYQSQVNSQRSGNSGNSSRRLYPFAGAR